MARHRYQLTIQGVVQGVGFRPFVYRLALAHDIAGSVCNDGRGVSIDAEGEVVQLRRFRSAIQREKPPLSTILFMRQKRLPPTGQSAFSIISSCEGAVDGALIPPDVATCDPCVAELLDPLDRRAGYPFINCTDCGPRFTIVRRLPYDRAQTTMAAFPMCPACQAEYDDPATRRYHAQPNACPVCGPRVWMLDPDGSEILCDDAVEVSIRHLEQGKILAIKGLGGFHLACDATHDAAVATLRRRKRRPDKPFAVMVRDMQAVHRLAVPRSHETRALLSRPRPIVLLDARRDSPLSAGVGGTSRWIGTMLPYTPLHHLLMRGAYPALVMTSGNLSDEPIVHTNAAAVAQLSHLVDALVVHDRDIEIRADDSVIRSMGRVMVPLRRSRGYVPAPLPLPMSGSSVLAVGGDLKVACAISRGAWAYLGPHIGDLDHPEAIEVLRSSTAHLARLLDVQPTMVVHDLHPDYHSTRFARSLGIETLAIQHHHAHALSCLADNGHAGPALALSLDGAGLGNDGRIWGGEVLAIDGLEWRRIGHLRYRALPGGDRAAREPWRMALSVLADEPSAGIDHDELALSAVIPADRIAAIETLCRHESTPRTSSAGRLFDAAASLLDLCHSASFEGQSGMALEQAAENSRANGTLPFVIRPVEGGLLEIDLGPALIEIARRGRTPRRRAAAARLFHHTVAQALVEAARQGAVDTGLEIVALSGGVFQNRLLTRLVVRALRRVGLCPVVHRHVPPNDGGLALGQLWAGMLAQHSRHAGP